MSDNLLIRRVMLGVGILAFVLFNLILLHGAKETIVLQQSVYSSQLVNRSFIDLAPNDTARVNVRLPYRPNDLGYVIVAAEPLLFYGNLSGCLDFPNSVRFNSSNWNRGRNMSFTRTTKADCPHFVLIDFIASTQFDNPLYEFPISVGSVTICLTDCPSFTATPPITPTPTSTDTPSQLPLTISGRDWLVGENIFYPLGAQDCVDPTGTGDLRSGWDIESGASGDITQWLDVFGEAGFNLFRLNQLNCSHAINAVVTINPATFEVSYFPQNAAKWRELMILARERNWRVLWTFFGFQHVPQVNITNSQTLNPLAMNSICNNDSIPNNSAIEFMISEFGEYVDMWQVLNETTARSNAWHQWVIPCIRAHDPRLLPIATSWEEYTRPTYNYDSPHRYLTVDEFDADDQMWSYRNSNPINRPLLFTEWGNGGVNGQCNYYPSNPTRAYVESVMRVFTGVGYIYWFTNIHPNYCPPSSGAANFYCDTACRQQLIQARMIVEAIPNDAELCSSVSYNNTLVDAYALCWSTGGGGIFIVADDVGVISGLIINVNGDNIVVPDFEYNQFVWFTS